MTLQPDETVLGVEEALPCPFCGSQPTIWPWHGGGPEKRLVECPDNGQCPVLPSVSGDTRALALEAWNHRTNHGNLAEDAGGAVRLRVLSHEQARQEMLALYRSANGPLSYGDVAERLRMDLGQVLKVAHELEQKGLIGRTETPGRASPEPRVGQ